MRSHGKASQTLTEAVGFVEEDRFEFVFGGARMRLLHDANMRLTRYVIDVSHDRQFTFRLVRATLHQLLREDAIAHFEPFDTRKLHFCDRVQNICLTTQDMQHLCIGRSNTSPIT